jgi:hypothetical protein
MIAREIHQGRANKIDWKDVLATQSRLESHQETHVNSPSTTGMPMAESRVKKVSSRNNQV